MERVVVAIFVLFIASSLWTSGSMAQQYQYSRGWTPGKRSGGLSKVREVDHYVGPPVDSLQYTGYEALPLSAVPASGNRVFSASDIEDIQRSAYIAGLLRDRPYGAPFY